MQIPEFFITANLQLHPFRAQPYLAVPSCTRLPAPALLPISTLTVTDAYTSNIKTDKGGLNASGPGAGWTKHSSKASKASKEAEAQGLSEGKGETEETVGGVQWLWEHPHYVSPVALVERLFLRSPGNAWIEDEPRRTNWAELGLPTPTYDTPAGQVYAPFADSSDRDRDMLESVSSVSESAARNGPEEGSAVPDAKKSENTSSNKASPDKSNGEGEGEKDKKGEKEKKGENEEEQPSLLSAPIAYLADKLLSKSSTETSSSTSTSNNNSTAPDASPISEQLSDKENEASSTAGSGGPDATNTNAKSAGLGLGVGVSGAAASSSASGRGRDREIENVGLGLREGAMDKNDLSTSNVATALHGSNSSNGLNGAEIGPDPQEPHPPSAESTKSTADGNLVGSLGGEKNSLPPGAVSNASAVSLLNPTGDLSDLSQILSRAGGSSRTQIRQKGPLPLPVHPSALSLSVQGQGRGTNMGQRSSASAQDRQYMHRQGIACVRVGAFGFVWLLNSGTRVSVVNSAAAERERKEEKEKEKEQKLEDAAGSASGSASTRDREGSNSPLPNMSLASTQSVATSEEQCVQEEWDTEEILAQTVEGRRELALTALKRLERYVNRSYV